MVTPSQSVKAVVSQVSDEHVENADTRKRRPRSKRAATYTIREHNQASPADFIGQISGGKAPNAAIRPTLLGIPLRSLILPRADGTFLKAALHLDLRSGLSRAGQA